MSYAVKFRPKKLADMVGNKSVVLAISRILSKPNVPKSWLLEGPSGIGKTTAARIIANRVGASSDTVVEINAADVRGIDGMRAIINQAQYQMIGAPRTVYILDECHQLTRDSQNSLLKILEEPPAHVFFILCTTNAEKILATIKTRCIKLRFKPVKLESIGELILDIVEKEGLEISHTTKHLSLIHI